MRVCRECGFPRTFSRFFEWRSDGTIIGRDLARNESQISFLPCGELERVFDSLSETIGLSVDRFLTQAEKNVGKAFFANTPLKVLRHAPHNRHVRPEFVARAMVRLVRFYVAGLGFGIISVDSYRGGDSMVLRFRNPCFAARLVGTSLGIYESVEKMPSAAYECSIQDGDLVISMSHSDEPQESLSETRLYLERVQPGIGPLEYERCGRCGVPLEAAGSFAWNIEEGIIFNRHTREREVVGAVQSVNAMMRELELELGEEVLQVIFDAQKALELERLGAVEAPLADVFWKGYLEDLGLRGLGYPLHFERRDGGVNVEIENPYNQVLYAAKIAAALEKISGNSTRIDWEKRYRDHGVYTIDEI